MNAAPFLPLLTQFADNWCANAAQFTISITGQELEVDDNHPIQGELVSLCSGRAASLPFFAKSKEVVWCTVAPDNDSLRQAVVALSAWVLPSFGGEVGGDGYVSPDSAKGALASAIISVAPAGYYRWRCPRHHLDKVCEKLRLRHSLEAVRPDRTRSAKPSLYELRARFASALLVGDREAAEKTIEILDALQLETAVNTQFMRIRLWHHFRELDRIRDHPELQHLLAQPLPPRVRAWINEALGQQPPQPPAPAPIPPPEPPDLPLIWTDWFGLVKKGGKEDKAAAETFLQDRALIAPGDLSSTAIEAIIAGVEELYSDDALRQRERPLVLQGAAELLDEFVREPGFPRASLGDLYLALLHLWSALHRGSSSGQEHGHVLLELASAALQLNRGSDVVRGLLEDWWKARPVPNQLPFALDAIELLDREVAGTDATANLWLACADVIQRNAQSLTATDRALWRRVGLRLGIDESAIAGFLPAEPSTAEQIDPLASVTLQHVAIVCLREAQAREAADIIRERTNAEVSIVASNSAGHETTNARQADVVLFVWMASTHAVFRAFDGFDRKRFCYVQGTGASSIVRTLERWAAGMAN